MDYICEKTHTKKRKLIIQNSRSQDKNIWDKCGNELSSGSESSTNLSSGDESNGNDAGMIYAGKSNKSAIQLSADEGSETDGRPLFSYK